jgi:hypothetical protein
MAQTRETNLRMALRFGERKKWDHTEDLQADGLMFFF